MTKHMMPIVTPVKTFYDNRAAMFMSKNPESKRCRHIDIRYHFIREMVRDQLIDLIYVPSADQIADLFTKPLGHRKFINLFDKVVNIDMRTILVLIIWIINNFFNSEQLRHLNVIF